MLSNSGLRISVTADQLQTVTGSTAFELQHWQILLKYKMLPRMNL